MPRVHPKAPVQPWGRLKSEGGWLNNLLAWSRLSFPTVSSAYRHPVALGGRWGLWGWEPRSWWSPLPSSCSEDAAITTRLSLPTTPWGSSGERQGCTGTADGPGTGTADGMGRRSPNPSRRAIPSQSSREAGGGQTHQRVQEPPENKNIKENPNIFATEKRMSRLLHLP